MKTYCATGTFESMTRSEVEAAIRQSLGNFAKKISGKTDALFAGEKPGRALKDATARGIPVLGEEQFLAMLEGKSLEEVLAESLPQAEEPAELDDLLVDLRGIAVEQATSEVWSQLLALLDGCDPEQLELAVDYLEPHIAAWDDQEMFAWIPPEHEDGHNWSSHNPSGDLRVAPLRWNEQLVQGDASPRWRLIRVLNLFDMGLTGKLGAKIFECPTLTRVERLQLSGTSKLTGPFFKALREWPHGAHLTHLYFGNGSGRKAGAYKALHGEHNLPNLRYLELGRYGKSHDAFLALLTAECVQAVDTLEIQTDNEPLFEALEEAPLPGLKHIVLSSFYGDECVDKLLGASFIEAIESLDFFGVHTTKEAIEKLLASEHIAGLQRLDLSRLLPQIIPGVEEWLGPLLLENTHLAQLGEVRIGQPWKLSDETRRAIEEAEHLQNTKLLHIPTKLNADTYIRQKPS